MRFEKSYLDLVGPAGAGCIGYAVRLPAARATVGGLLEWPVDRTSSARQTRTLRGTWPGHHGEDVVWQCPALALTGTWRRTAPPISKVLWAAGDHEVRWQVQAPAADVSLEVDGRRYTGAGYAETLSLDVAPWRLPIDTLRWGRFVGEGHHVVWIVWEHAERRQWLWHDGDEHLDLRADDTQIVWPAGRLQFARPRVLRRGRLGQTALHRWPTLQRFLPRGILQLDETKWCAEGTLTNAAGRVAQGWVIHEVVLLR